MRLRRDIIHKTTGLGFSKRWVSFHKTTRIFFEGFSHPFFAPRSESVLLFVLSRRGGCLMGLNRVWTGFERVWTGFAQCLFNGCSMLVQWLFNACSMAVQWLFNGWRKVVSMRCILRFLLRAWMRTRLLFMFHLPWVFVFWWLRIEFIWVVVFPGRRGKEGVSKCTFWIHPRRYVREGVWMSLETFFLPQWRHKPNVFCPEERKVKRHSAR